ncbi:MAG: DUF134 domain-containing protein [Campylobacterota bacterium]|nr:DUF134 domain-containing protein [Campylobacterota bacterium]
MAREKNIRKLNFKPIIKSYVPETIGYTGTTSLLHEEIEAIYLMDVLNLYQEDAAKSMQISRPTFTRILKSARKKLANAIVAGYKIVLEDSKNETIIAFCSNDKNSFDKIEPLEKYILIYKIENKNIELIKVIESPIFIDDLKPAIELPKILLENKVNVFISSKIGNGLKHSLLSTGIKPIIKNNIDINNLRLF